MPEKPLPMKFTILIIEDSDAFRFMLREAVKEAKNGFEISILEADTLKKAETLIRNADCVILDLTLPDSDEPINTLYTVRSWVPTTPVMVVTGNQSKHVPYECGRLGAVTCLIKPDVGPPLTSAVGCLIGQASIGIQRDAALVRRLESV